MHGFFLCVDPLAAFSGSPMNLLWIIAAGSVMAE
jgi:hypothetical protein